MTALNLTASDIDLMFLAAFIAACFINRAAIIVLAFQLADVALFAISETGLIACLSLATLYSINSIVNIRIKSEIRQGLICLGAVYWLGAVDYWYTDEITIFFVLFPYLITLIDVYILWHLVGGLRNGIHSPVGNCWPARL